MALLPPAFLFWTIFALIFLPKTCNGHVAPQLGTFVRVPSSLKIDFADKKISLDVDMTSSQLVTETARINEVLGRVEFMEGNNELWKAGLTALNKITEWASRIAMDNRRAEETRRKFANFRETAGVNRNNIESLVTLREGTADPNFCYSRHTGSSSKRSKGGNRTNSRYLVSTTRRIQVECYREEFRCVFGIDKAKHCVQCAQWCGKAIRCNPKNLTASLSDNLAKKMVYCLRNALFCSVHRCWLPTDGLYIILPSKVT